MANSLEKGERNIQELTKISRDYGLEINKEKSQVIIFNMKEKPSQIMNIKVSDNIKYLGIIINDNRNCFKKHKEKMMEKASQLANITQSVIGKSCSKILIGKTFWKTIALPSILYGTNIMNITKTEIEKLQRIENSVYRQILGAPQYTQGTALHGEID